MKNNAFDMFKKVDFEKEILVFHWMEGNSLSGYLFLEEPLEFVYPKAIRIKKGYDIYVDKEGNVEKVITLENSLWTGLGDLGYNKRFKITIGNDRLRQKVLKDIIFFGLNNEFSVEGE